MLDFLAMTGFLPLGYLLVLDDDVVVEFQLSQDLVGQVVFHVRQFLILLAN